MSKGERYIYTDNKGEFILLTLTAPVGQAVLRSAIRLSDNFIKFREVAVFDPGASGCYDCLHAGSDLCANCPNKVYHKEMKKIYVNEKARYGERMTLSRNAILVFVYLHFLSPDENGFIRMVNVQEAAEFLHCCPRTVRNSLNALASSGYIAVRKLENSPCQYSVFLSDFRDYFRTAKEGGRGYLLLTRETFLALAGQSTINSLRLAVRSILSFADGRERADAQNPRSYPEIARALPGYCSRKHILAETDRDAFRKIFDVQSDRYTIRMRIRADFDPAGASDLLRKDCESAVLDLLKELNKNASRAHRLSFTKAEMRDISGIALRYSVPNVLHAIRQVMREYIETDRAVKNVGALIRTYAKANAAFSDEVNSLHAG